MTLKTGSSEFDANSDLWPSIALQLLLITAHSVSIVYLPLAPLPSTSDAKRTQQRTAVIGRLLDVSCRGKGGEYSLRRKYLDSSVTSLAVDWSCLGCLAGELHDVVLVTCTGFHPPALHIPHYITKLLFLDRHKS